jgi:hypothetical protein
VERNEEYLNSGAEGCFERSRVLEDQKRRALSKEVPARGKRLNSIPITKVGFFDLRAGE